MGEPKNRPVRDRMSWEKRVICHAWHETILGIKGANPIWEAGIAVGPPLIAWGIAVAVAGVEMAPSTVALAIGSGLLWLLFIAIAYVVWNYIWTPFRQDREQRGELAALRAGATKPIASVATFHIGNTAYLYITNEGPTDEFAVQVVGWSKDEPVKGETSAPWHLRWSDSDETRRVLNHTEVAQIEFASIKTIGARHKVVETGEDIPEEYAAETLLWIQCPEKRRLFGEFWGMKRHADDASNLKPWIFHFLVRITASGSDRSRTVALILRVIGRVEDDPHHRMACVNRPVLWLDPLGAEAMPSGQSTEADDD